jgi:hypothetical protein
MAHSKHFTERTHEQIMAAARVRPEEPGAGVKPHDFVDVALYAARTMLDCNASAAKAAFGPGRVYHLLNDVGRMVEAVAQGDYSTARSKLETIITSRDAMLRETLAADAAKG